MSTIAVIGIGPGDPDLLTLKARDVLQNADVVAAFESVLVPVRRWIRGEARSIRYADQEEVLDDIASLSRHGKRCVVCVWGDVTFSARELIDRVRQRVDCVELIPGVSSAQVACARLGLDLERSLFVTLHVREGFRDAMRELLVAVRSGARNVVLLPRPWDLMPAAIARELVQEGVEEATEVCVLEQLTLPAERITRFTLTSLASSALDFSDLTIMVFPVPRAESPS